MSENEDRDQSGGQQPAQDEPGAFDAFRAWRAAEQAGNEPPAAAYEPGYSESGYYETRQYEPGQYEPGQYGPGQHEPGQYEQGQYESEPTTMLPPGPGYAQPMPAMPSDARGRGRLRSAAALAGAVALVAGVVFGVYEATKPSGSASAAGSPAVSASPDPSNPDPSAGASKGAKNGKATLARLTVTSVGTDSFTATAADGGTVSVQIKPTTKFGTAARPFARSQLVPGAVVYARLRHEADGSVVATVIASATAGKGSPSATATSTADSGA